MKLTMRVTALAFAGAMLLGACGSDGDTSADAPATAESGSADTTAAGTDNGVLVDELVAAGLSDDEAECVVSGAEDAWGVDALTAAGEPTDDQLTELAAITFGCQS